MLDKLRREYAQLLTSGAQLLLVLVGIHQHSRNGWLACFSAIALVSVFAWLSSLYRLRAIRGNPISKIGSAAQGYVELLGQGRPFGDAPLLSALRRRPCLWYRYKIEKREFPQWNMKESGESSDSFILRDDTGECAVDPEHAEIFTMHCDRWHEEDCRYTEWKLIEHDQLFVAGHFRTIGGNTLEFDSHAELSALLAEWKKDMPALLARFDLDKDGVLDMNEWFLARQAAKREVEQAMREARAHPEINIVGRPPAGQFYLISNLPRNRLSRRYLIWAWAHLVIFFGSMGGLGWALRQGT